MGSIVKRSARIISAREAAVLRLLKLGHHYKAIAHELGISESTARVHCASARRKLERAGLAEIVWI